MPDSTWSTTLLDPKSYLYSTYLHSKVVEYTDVADRICLELGAPMVNLEIHGRQIFQNITRSVEMFSRYAGHTEELLVFDSNLYTPKSGMDIGTIMTYTPDISSVYNTPVSAPDVGLLSTSPVSGFYDDLIGGTRKVIELFSVEEANRQGLNTLFTIEQTLAQQTYFSYAMGNYGFDLISWYVMKEWLEVREKVLSVKRHYRFDKHRQRLYLHPEPEPGARFFAVVGCYVEKPIREMLREPWVYEYALALSKINIGRVRNKYTGTSLFGGGGLDTSLIQEGREDKKELEVDMRTSLTPGWGASDPPAFFVG